MGLFLSLFAAASGEALAYAIITINPTGDRSSYTVSVTGLEDAQYVGFTITYDPSTLSNPLVEPRKMSNEADAAIQANSATPGLLSVSFLSRGVFKGPGDLAVIRFKRIGSALPLITKGESSALTTASLPLAVDLVVNKEAALIADANANVETKNESGDRAKTAQTTPTGGMSSIFNGRTVDPPSSSGGSSSGMTDAAGYQQPYRQQSGGVTVSGNTPFSQESKREEPRRDEARGKGNDSSSYKTPPAYNPPVASSSARPVQEASPAVGVKEAVAQLNTFVAPVQRFSTFNGIRNLKNLLALFDSPAALQAGITQTPQVVISDGKSLVKLRIELATGAVVPNFSLKSANLKAIHPFGDKVWELEALPQKGKSDVRLSVFIKNEKVDIPVLVIPPLDAPFVQETGDLSEKGVSAVLAKMIIKSDKPPYDLNKDGLQNYLDDMVLVGHYLLKHQNPDQGSKKPGKIANKN